MPVIHARGRAEAYEYMRLALGDCTFYGFDVEPVRRYSSPGSPVVTVYVARCPSTAESREFEFTADLAPDDAPDRLVYGFGPEPSKLIDAGQWVQVLFYYHTMVELQVKDLENGWPDPAGAEYLLDMIWRARAAAEEILKFIPEGADSPPDSAFWTEVGRKSRADFGDRSWRAKMQEYIDTYVQLEAILRERYSQGA
jgi:hypothetical protein